MPDSCCTPASCAEFLNHLERNKASKNATSGPSESEVLRAVEQPACESILLSKDFLCDRADDDILAAAGVKLPAMYSTRLRRWICLTAFSFVSACASGPMTMWPTLEPILVQEHVFRGPSQLAQLSEVYALTIGILVLSFLPVGIAYDCYGPRCLAVVGSLLFAVFAVIMGVSIRYQSLNWMLYYAYPIALLFGFGKNYGAYGFQWLLPESQNTVNSVIAATQALSDALVLVCVWLHDSYGMSLWTYFYALSVFAVVTGFICSYIVPSKKQHFAYAGAVLSYMASLEAPSLGYGSTSIDTETGGTGESGGQSTVKTSGWRWWDNVRGTYNVACHHPVEHVLFVSGCCALYMFTWYPTVQMYPFYFAMFGKDGATYLVNSFAVIYGFFGAVAIIFAGRMIDWLGMRNAMLFNNVLVFAVYVTIMVETVKSQLICQIFITLSISLFTMFCFRFCMIYAPPEIFGTYVGVLMSFMGGFQIILSSITNYLMVHLKGYEILMVHGMVSFFGVVTFLSWNGLVLWWRWHPEPAAGSISRLMAGLPEESEYEAAEGKDDDEGWF